MYALLVGSGSQGRIRVRLWKERWFFGDRMLKRILFSTLFAAAVAVFFQSAGLGVELLGDEDDGSKTEHPHLMHLWAESGELEEGTDEPIPSKVMPSDELMRPFSTRHTCAQCHAYEDIRNGWHFNYTDPNVDAGRAGHPWVLVDWQTGTQIPVSYRDWPGAFKPAELGLSSWDFIRYFGRQIPGGGAGELEGSDPARQMVSGKLEINCLACHNADSGQDMMEGFGWSQQIAAENFRWAAAASSEYCTVTGVAKKQDWLYDPFMEDEIKTSYRPGTFDDAGRVLFDVGGKPKDVRCYYCHSTTNVAQEDKWVEDKDVHTAAGLACVDCHRGGIEHHIIRGYEGADYEYAAQIGEATTCEGCHMETGDGDMPEAGRFGAPVPEHAGIPDTHFEKLTCTACHSGLWPKEDVQRVKTSMGHGLGLLTLNLSDQMLPHIQTPVFALNDEGKIAPHNAVWPAYWSIMNDSNVAPLELEMVKTIVSDMLGAVAAEEAGNWPMLTDEHITNALAGLAEEGGEGKPVYVAGGRVYELDEAGKLMSREHEAARPYLWPIAHNVRGTAQSLGARACEDCHSEGAPFAFGQVDVDSPLESRRGAAITMAKFQKADACSLGWLAWAFSLRPCVLVAVLVGAAIVGLVLLVYLIRAAGFVFRLLGD